MATTVFCGTIHAEIAHDRLFLLHVGDEVAFDFQQSVSVLAVTKKTDHVVTLRIATATKDVLSRENITSWLHWFHQGCPGATSDETISLRTDQVTGVQAEDAAHVAWLLTLLQLDIKKIPEEMRKKAGPPPLSGELDLRTVWQPQIFVQGHKIECESTAFSAQWPNDGSDLSSRVLILYFPRSQKAVQALPYWIESPSSSFHVQIIDSTHASEP